MRPYGDNAESYWEAGWRGILPLPAKRKEPPPYGFTGANGQWPSFPDVWAWIEGPEGDGNLALRLPSNVLGIDVDAYSSKVGRQTFEAAIAKWGVLPQTWVSSSRDDGVSGIYLFRVPDDLRWPGELGPGVELIQRRHRYMVAPPSVHPSGRTYKWLTNWTTGTEEVPRIEALAQLPDAWVQGLTAGVLAHDVSKVWVTNEQVADWIQAAPGGPLCGQMRQAVVATTGRLREAQHSRHETATRGVMRLAHLGSEGHHGAADALGIVHGVFMAVATQGGSARTPEGAGGEWERIVYGAVGVVMPDGFDDADPCTNPLGVSVTQEVNTETPTPINENVVSDLISTPVSGNTETGDLIIDDPKTLTTLNGHAPHGPILPQDPELAFMVEQALLRQRANEIARDTLAREKAHALFRLPVFVPNLADELALPDEEAIWTITDVLPAKANVLLTAQYKTGKTTLVNHFAKSLTDGTDFLNRFVIHTPEVNVAIWNYEVAQAMYRRWMRELLIKNPERISMAHLRGYTVPLLVPTVQDWAVAWLKERNVHTWVVDPAARAMAGADENSNQEVGLWLDALDSIKERAGVTNLILVTHTGRAEHEPGKERARGATRFDDWADVRWLLTKDDDGFRYFRATGRDVDTDEFRLIFEPLTRGLSASDEERPRKQPSKSRAVSDGELADAILRSVRAVPGQTVRTLETNVRAQLRVRSQRIYEQVKAMESQRLVVSFEGKNHGRVLYPPDIARAMHPLTAAQLGQGGS